MRDRQLEAVRFIVATTLVAFMLVASTQNVGTFRVTNYAYPGWLSKARCSRSCSARSTRSACATALRSRRPWRPKTRRRLAPPSGRAPPDALQRWNDIGASLPAFVDLRDASVVARRLLHEAVAGFDPRDGRVVVDEGATHVHGNPESPTVLELALDHGDDVVGRLQLLPRWNGRLYDERDHALPCPRADALARIIWLARRDAAGMTAAKTSPEPVAMLCPPGAPQRQRGAHRRHGSPPTNNTDRGGRPSLVGNP